MIFDDWKSIFHAIIGFIAGFILYFLPLFTVLFFIFFFTYQFFESESKLELLSDSAEFIIGFVVGLLSSYCCIHVFNISF
jgi:multisubunit Na+/H+ antiporter MnhE subunit